MPTTISQMKRSSSTIAFLAKYKLAKMSTDVQEALKRISIEMKNNGIKHGKIRTIFEDAGYPVPTTTLYNWRKKIKMSRSAMKSAKSSGNTPSLFDFECRVLAGNVISCNEANDVITGNDLLYFIKEVFQKTGSLTMVNRIIERYEIYL